MRETIRVIKQGGAVGVFPEGRLSAYGQPETISPTTLRFLRRLGVPVIAVNIEGSYCVRPKWNTNLRKGAVKVTARPLFSAEDLKNLDDATAQQRLVDALAYDEHESALRRGASYEGADFARGLQNILYLCPKCGKTFVTDTEGNRIFCRSCANEGRLDGAYGLTPYGGSAKIPPTIAEWYILQKKREAGLIANNPDYRLRDEVVLKKPLCGGEMFTEVGSGEAILDKDGLHYRGTQHGQPFELDVPLHMISALPYGADCDFELTYHGEFYYFEPSRRRECVRWSVAAEQLYLHYVKGEVE